jgi:hypothetical protein
VPEFVVNIIEGLDYLLGDRAVLVHPGSLDSPLILAALGLQIHADLRESALRQSAQISG